MREKESCADFGRICGVGKVVTNHHNAMRCIDFEQLRLLSVNTLDKPKKKRHNHMLGLVRMFIIAAITAIGFAACVNPELKHSANANLVRAAAREWLAHHPAFVARNGDYVSGVAVWPDHAEVPLRSAFGGDVHAILRLERIGSSWKVISTAKPPAKQSNRPNQSLERTAAPSRVYILG
jgi:hypothetical protein